MEYQPRATPVHRSLLEQKTIGGVESRMAILNGTLAAALTFGMMTVYFLPFAVLLHLVLRWITKKDAKLIEIYTRYRIFGEVYDPWPKAVMRVNARPKGFAKGLLC